MKKMFQEESTKNHITTKKKKMKMKKSRLNFIIK